MQPTHVFRNHLPNETLKPHRFGGKIRSNAKAPHTLLCAQACAFRKRTNQETTTSSWSKQR
jgi:hypothetical protein